MATGWWFNIDEEVSENLALPVVSNTDFNLFYRNGKSIKMATASVNVSSSDVVAEIIGKQGCKIKDLRAKTNTFVSILKKSNFSWNNKILCFPDSHTT